jgi:hypothetical protein
LVWEKIIDFSENFGMEGENGWKMNKKANFKERTG